MMRKLPSLILLLLFTFAGSIPPAMGQEVITLTLPESVIAKAFTAILPLPIDAHSKSLQGDITIKNISDLQLTDNQLACRLHLVGNNMAFVTELAGHEIKLKVGVVEVDFQTNATLRFDAAQQTLFIKPMVKNLAPRSKDANTDISQALVALLNAKEFPVTLQNLDPIIAKSGAKTIIINTRITDISARPKVISLSLVPLITAK
jgi:hypothetical protein